MSRFTKLSLAALLIFTVVFPTQVEASGLKECWHGFLRDTHRNKCWPRPFVAPDRAAAQAPFNLMVANGWRRQNLIADYHFTPDHGELNQAGRLKMQWILTQAPVNFRTIFVQRGEDENQTAERIDAIQRVATTITNDGELPDVRETHILPEGRAASVVDQVNVRFQESSPAPRLPGKTGG